MGWKRKACLAAALTAALLLSGCKIAEKSPSDAGAAVQNEKGLSEEPFSKEIFAMDTYMTVTAYGANAKPAVEDAVDEIQRLDVLLSIGSAESEISKLNASGSAIVSDDTAGMLEKAMELYQTTDGAFDITVLPFMEAWGFTTGAYHVPTEEQLKELSKVVDAGKLVWDTETKRLTMLEGQKLDFGGIAKGYTSGRIMEIFRSYGITSGMVSLGGNVQLMGTKADGSRWKVGIQDPDDAEGMLGVLETADCAVITSGGYERYFEQDGITYHHILDPKTGRPSDSGLLSVTIVSGDGTLADGLSTSLFVMGIEKASAYWKQYADMFDAVFVDEDRQVYVTEGISDAFSYDGEVTVIRQD